MGLTEETPAALGLEQCHSLGWGIERCQVVCRQLSAHAEKPGTCGGLDCWRKAAAKAGLPRGLASQSPRSRKGLQIRVEKKTVTPSQ